jgi:hypothetical protein
MAVLLTFLADVISGNRKIDDLEIRYKVCNILNYVESVLTPFIVQIV